MFTIKRVASYRQDEDDDPVAGTARLNQPTRQISSLSREDSFIAVFHELRTSVPVAELR